MHDSRRTRLILGVLLAAALALITFDSWNGAAGAGRPVAGLRGVGGTVFGSAESLVGAVTRPVAAFFGNVTRAPASQQQIAGLQREVVRLRTELSQAQLSQAQEAQLRRVLALAGRGGYRIVAANVIAASPGYNSAVTIDAGRDDGIKPDETVLNGAGLVGTVTSVTSTTSTVLLATDASVTVGVRLAGTGQPQVVQDDQLNQDRAQQQPSGQRGAPHHVSAPIPWGSGSARPAGRSGRWRWARRSP